MDAVKRKSGRRRQLAALLVGAAVVLTACAPGIRLDSRTGGPSELPEGTYTLFFYGCGHAQRIDNVVIIAPEGRGWTHEIHGPKFEYTVRTGVPAADALAEADRFLRCSVYYRKTILRSMVAPDGRTLGYELRPLYLPYDFGREDVFLNDFRLKDGNRVVSYIQLEHSVERLIRGETDDQSSSSASPGPGGK